ncbi:MAG TPA: hypothetical protein DEB31_07125 [Clostridiales bacterium]|nr:hypothetical protein [Clostridiales bacterium]
MSNFSRSTTVKKQARWIFWAMTALFLAVFLLGAPAVAKAEGGLEMTTAYPGVTAKAGENVSFDLALTNANVVPITAELSVTSLPDGWEGYFEGGGSNISSVTVTPTTAETDPAEATFNLTIPEDAADGDYSVTLRADAGDGVASTLNLSLNVSELELSQGQFTSQYPELAGPAAATFSYTLNLSNNSGVDRSYSLLSQAQEGWQVAFKPAGEINQIASLTVEAGKSQALDVTITPPATVTAGAYTIPCAAVSADETLQTELSVTITGSYALTLSTPSGNLSLDAYADRETPVTLAIANTGSADLQGVALSSSVPESWNVRFETATIDTLPAGTSQEVTAYITPGPSVISGDYVASITAGTAEAAASADFRVTVKTRTSWGIVGVVIIALLAVALVLVFRRFGRR